MSGTLPWWPDAGSPPQPFVLGPWKFFTSVEGATIEALVDRIIPPDPETPGGKEAGCAVFIDRQLCGPYGENDGLYNNPPFRKGTKSQGPQGKAGPAQQYRIALAALDRASQAKYGGKAFAALEDTQKDALIALLEAGEIPLPGLDAKDFFKSLLKDVQEGFFADPIYGGNRNMAGWRMIGFPGTRYDYRDWIDRHNERFPLPPVSLGGRAEWVEHGA